MELTVFWTYFAEIKLEDIFEFYKKSAGEKIAEKIVIEIIDTTIDLEKMPNIGQVEELLNDRKQEFRYLIHLHFKIIYWINLEKQRIEIVNVFDTRQNPKKLSQT